VIEGNLFCTDKTGAVSMGTSSSGINISGGGGAGNTSNMTIGGLTAAAANTLACNAANLSLTNMSDVRVQGNNFGTDVSGSFGFSLSTGIGVYLTGGDSTVVIGGTAPGAGNVIGGLLRGIASFSGTDVVIQGNFIGTDATLTKDLGNTSEGIYIQSTSGLTIGGTAPGEANSIVHNRGNGIHLDCCGTGNTIRGNRIFDNLGVFGGVTTLAINLIGSQGPEIPDAGDADTGGNDLQNSPLITSSAPEGGSTRVMGFLDSTPSSQFTLDFYADPVCRARPRGQDQADQYLGSTTVSTDASGTVAFNVLLPTATVAGQPVTATATNANGSTSELSPQIVFSAMPPASPAAGGTSIAIQGMKFVAGATVSIGGVPATGVDVASATQINATTPALPAGTVHDIVVTLPGGFTGTLRNGYVSQFLDAGGAFSDFIAKLAGNQITAGCGNGNYCTGASVTRAQMAVFMLRGKSGLCYTPPPATGTVFADVPAGNPYARWIEALANAGIAGGCSPGYYCPNDAVNRAQMAVFLLRTLEGPAYVPPPCTTATFADVPCSSPFSKWIYELVHRNITAGCGGGNYCAVSAVSRGQMAVFLAATFGLP
jgi:hypothetical protein